MSTIYSARPCIATCTLSLQARVDKQPQPAASLPAPTSAPDLADIKHLVQKLLFETAQEEARVSDEVREATDRALDSAERKVVAQMRDKVAAVWVEGLGKAVGQGISAGLSLGSALASKPSTNSVADASTTAKPSAWSISGKLSEAAGEAVSTFGKASVADQEASVRAKEHVAAHLKRADEGAASQHKEALEHLRRVLDILRELRSSEHQSAMAAIRA